MAWIIGALWSRCSGGTGSVERVGPLHLQMGDRYTALSELRSLRGQSLLYVYIQYQDMVSRTFPATCMSALHCRPTPQQQSDGHCRSGGYDTSGCRVQMGRVFSTDIKDRRLHLPGTIKVGEEES